MFMYILGYLIIGYILVVLIEYLNPSEINDSDTTIPQNLAAFYTALILWPLCIILYLWDLLTINKVFLYILQLPLKALPNTKKKGATYNDDAD